MEVMPGLRGRAVRGGPRRRGTYVKLCPSRAGRMGCAVHTSWWLPRARPFRPPPSPLPQSPGFSSPGIGSREGGHVRGGAATSHRSDSPTDARSVGSGGRRPREETGESGEEMGSYLEYGAVRRFPMRSAAARRGTAGSRTGGRCLGGLFNRVEPRGAISYSRAVRAWHVSTSQLTLGRSPGRAAGPRRRGTNLKNCPGRDG